MTPNVMTTDLTDIDQRINHLYDLLEDLYAERAQLLSQPAAETAMSASQPTTPARLYQYLQSSWVQTNLALPAYEQLKPLLQAALKRRAVIVEANPDYATQLSIVLVPPTPQLQQAMAEGKVSIRFETDSLPDVPAAKTWRALVVLNASWQVPNDRGHASLKAELQGERSDDLRGLAVSELIAAELQGEAVADRQGWTVLATEPAQPNQVACVTRRGQMLVFDTDDANCLLGDNRLVLAAEA